MDEDADSGDGGPGCQVQPGEAAAGALVVAVKDSASALPIALSAPSPAAMRGVRSWQPGRIMVAAAADAVCGVL